MPGKTIPQIPGTLDNHHAVSVSIQGDPQRDVLTYVNLYQEGGLTIDHIRLTPYQCKEIYKIIKDKGIDLGI